MAEEQNPPETGKEGEQQQTSTPPPETGGEDHKAEAEKWKGLSRKNERELREAQDRLKALEDKDKSDLEKAQSKAADLEKTVGTRDEEVKSLRVKVAVMGAASKHGIGDLDAATKLLDWGQIEYDDRGEPKNVDALLGSLVKEKPFLKTTGRVEGSANGGEGDGAEGGATFNDMVRKQARR